MKPMTELPEGIAPDTAKNRTTWMRRYTLGRRSPSSS